MTVEDRLDLAGIFSRGEIGRIHDELLGIGCQVLAWPIPTPTFDHHHQATRLAGVVAFGVIHCRVAPAHEVNAPMPGKDPNGNEPVDPNRSLQLSSRLPQISKAKVATV